MTPKQKAACERNWALLQLRGAEALLYKLSRTSGAFREALEALHKAMEAENFRGAYMKVESSK